MKQLSLILILSLILVAGCVIQEETNQNGNRNPAGRQNTADLHLVCVDKKTHDGCDQVIDDDHREGGKVFLVQEFEYKKNSGGRENRENQVCHMRL